MKTILMGLAAAFSVSGALAATTLTYPDLVKRITDLEHIALLPEEGERCALWSSYDRKSRYDEATTNYVDWFANDDGKGFIREENGKQVLAEMNGPGCIWRVWSATPEKAPVRIYLDGAQEPAVDLPFADYFQSGGLAGFPALIYKTAANGFNLRVPIPYQTSCKIVADPGWGKYFQFTYSTFPSNTMVPTFSRKTIAEHFAALQQADILLSDRLGRDPAGARQDAKTVSGTFTLPPGVTTTILQLEGARAITAFKVTLDTNGLAVRPTAAVEKADEAAASAGSVKSVTKELAGVERALRAVTVSMTWDDEAEPAVWAPLGDFFGTGPGINLYKTLPMGMTTEGFYSYWYMPFTKKAVVEMANDGAVPVKVTCSFTHAPLPKGNHGRFHAKWHRAVLMPEEASRDKDWRILKATQRGRFLGVALNVWNPRGDWWGEGDEKFYVDGEKFPSTFGTGSEDYFGYAWSSGKLFQQALHSQSRNDGQDNRGHLSVNRWHIADNVPFQASFEADIEKYFANARPTLYDGVAYWYQMPGAPDLYKPQGLQERIGGFATPEMFKVKDAIEGEDLKVLEKTGGNASRQDMEKYHGRWSDARQLFWNGTGNGDELTLELPIKTTSRYEIVAQLTKAPDYGIVQAAVDGDKIGPPVDCYSSNVVPSGPIKLDTIYLTAGSHKISLKIAGVNEKSASAFAGLDYILLKPKD